MNTPQFRSSFRRAVASSSLAMVLVLCSFAIAQISSSNEVAAQHKDGHDHAGHNHDRLNKLHGRSSDSFGDRLCIRRIELTAVYVRLNKPLRLA